MEQSHLPPAPGSLVAISASLPGTVPALPSPFLLAWAASPVRIPPRGTSLLCPAGRREGKLSSAGGTKLPAGAGHQVLIPGALACSVLAPRVLRRKQQHFGGCSLALQPAAGVFVPRVFEPLLEVAAEMDWCWCHWVVTGPCATLRGCEHCGPWAALPGVWCVHPIG